MARVTGNARYAVALVMAAGLGVTLLITTAPALTPEYQNRALHVAKETAAALVLLLAAALLAGRFRRNGSLRNLLALTGVLVLAVKNLVFSVLAAILTETSGGLTTWRTTGAGMLGAGLLAAAAFVPEEYTTGRRRPVVLALALCVGGMGALIGVASLFELPAAFVEPPETKGDLHPLSQHPALLVADCAATALFLFAGVAFAHRAERDDDEFELWLGIGCAIAGVAYLNYALFPSLYTDFLYSGDIFRVLAVVAWGIGTVREISAYQSAFASAAVLEERRRVARDIHDGVAQELAFISTQMHWLNQHPESRDTSTQIMEAVTRALDESRGAIAALSRPVAEPLHLALTHTAEEIAKRVGAKVEVDIDTRVTVSEQWQEALQRIVREAVANSVRHGRARTVSVELHDADGTWLRVSDDGEGFDTTAPKSSDSYGIIGMRERTAALGGEFRLSSEPGSGTTIEVLLP